MWMDAQRIFLSCNVFRSWSIMNIQERNQIYYKGIYLLHFLQQHLTVFVDLVYWCGLEKGTLHFDIFSVKFSSHVGCGHKKMVKHGDQRGISFLFID